MCSILKYRALDIKLPPEQPVDREMLFRLGMSREEALPLNKLQKLLKHYLRSRNGIAHFIIEDDADSEPKRMLSFPMDN